MPSIFGIAMSIKGTHRKTRVGNSGFIIDNKKRFSRRRLRS
jgi:hypothetical protein